MKGSGWEASGVWEIREVKRRGVSRRDKLEGRSKERRERKKKTKNTRRISRAPLSGWGHCHGNSSEARRAEPRQTRFFLLSLGPRLVVSWFHITGLVWDWWENVHLWVEIHRRGDTSPCVETLTSGTFKVDGSMLRHSFVTDSRWWKYVVFIYTSCQRDVRVLVHFLDTHLNQSIKWINKWIFYYWIII